MSTEDQPSFSIDPNLPLRPARISREEARVAKERQKLFDGALKAHAKPAGWRYAYANMYRQHGDWFVSVLPTLLWGRGVTAMLLAKPMAVDPLFWRIVGLPENERLPLSFRANGAWVLRSPDSQANFALEERDPVRLADEVMRWSTGRLNKVAASSVESLLLELEELGSRRGHFAALEICLHLLRGEPESALALCRNRTKYESGGFRTGNKTFFDQARDWITETHRNEVGL